MKKLVILAIALAGFSAAGFAQKVPAAKKNEAPKTQVKKVNETKKPTKTAELSKGVKSTTPAVAKKTTPATASPASLPTKKHVSPKKKHG